MSHQSTTNNPRKCTVPTNDNGEPVNARPHKKAKNTKLTAKPPKKKPEPTSRTPNTISKLPKVPPMQRPSVEVEEISSDDDDKAQPLPPRMKFLMLMRTRTKMISLKKVMIPSSVIIHSILYRELLTYSFQSVL